MSMTTQCPSCGTTFRVTPQQLQSQQGMVRCGRCATVFDGFKALATLPEAAPAEPRAHPVAVAPAPAVADLAEVSAAPAAQAAAAAPAVEADNAAEAAAPDPVPETSIDVAGSPAGPVSAAAAEASAPTVAPPVAEPRFDAVPVAATAAAAVPPSAPASAAFDRPADPFPQAPRRGLWWALASLVMLLILGAQFVYLYRGDIAAAWPEARPLLNQGCGLLNCTVALPQRPRQITIEASDMQAADAGNAGLIVLTATLRNQAAVTVGYPALDVVLTNTRDHTVARRIFLPNEYLTDSREWRAGMAPSAEVTIRLHIDSGDLGAAGFRLELMAAPAA